MGRNFLYTVLALILFFALGQGIAAWISIAGGHPIGSKEFADNCQTALAVCIIILVFRFWM
jgi:hypothetical protein